MTGNELAAALRRSKGKVSVGMLTANDVAWVYAEKADLIEWARKQGDRETGMNLSEETGGGGWFLGREDFTD